MLSLATVMSDSNILLLNFFVKFNTHEIVWVDARLLPISHITYLVLVSKLFCPACFGKIISLGVKVSLLH